MSQFATDVARVVQTSSSCVPALTSLTSMTNTHHAILTVLQMARMPKCVRKRLVISCSPELQKTSWMFTEQCSWAGEVLHASDFDTNDFVTMTWMKWMLIRDATLVGPTLWVDADILVLSNPFSDLDLSASILFQRESNLSGINTGLIYTTNHTLASILWEQRPQNTSIHLLEQPAVATYVRKNFKYGLLSTRYVGKCWQDYANVTTAITWHAHCIGRATVKIDKMIGMLTNRGPTQSKRRL